MTPTVVDLFCGAGGASCGARLAGAHVALAVDACSHALSVHRANHPDTFHVCTTLPSDHIGLAFQELVARLPEGCPVHVHASPPCQTFSPLNRRALKENRERAIDLLRWAIRFARCNGHTWSVEQVGSLDVQRVMREEGVDFEIFDMSCLGVAQSRKRLIAASQGILAELRRQAECGKTRRPRLVDAIPRDQCRGTHVRNCTVNTYRASSGVRELIRMSEDHPSFKRAITETPYCVTGSSPLRWWTAGDAQCQTFTPREMASLQGFPSDYVIDHDKKRAKTQIGNALPPEVMRRIIVASSSSASE